MPNEQILNLTVFLPNFNNGKYLVDCLKSFNEFAYIPKQVLIIDDGSTDNSINILNQIEMNYDNVRTIRFSNNKGIGVSRSRGIKEVKTKYVAFIDPDDLAMEDRFKKQVDFLQKNSEIDVLGTNATYFSSSNNKILKTQFPLDHDSILKRFKSGDNGVLQGTVMMKSDVAKQADYYQEDAPVEDYAYFSRLINKKFRFANLNDVLTLVRIHEPSATHQVKFTTVNKIFENRKQIFGIKYNRYQLKRYHIWINNYRRFLSTKKLWRYSYLLRAVFFNPQKIIQRFFDQ